MKATRPRRLFRSRRAVSTTVAAAVADRLGDRHSYRPATGARRHDPALDLCGGCEAEFRKWLGPPPGRKGTRTDAA